jgi:hypothetical protein
MLVCITGFLKKCNNIEFRRKKNTQKQGLILTFLPKYSTKYWLPSVNWRLCHLNEIINLTLNSVGVRKHKHINFKKKEKKRSLTCFISKNFQTTKTSGLITQNFTCLKLVLEKLKKSWKSPWKVMEFSHKKGVWTVRKHKHINFKKKEKKRSLTCFISKNFQTTKTSGW